MRGLRAVGLVLAAALVTGAAVAGDTQLTIEAIFGDVPIEGRLPRDLQWLPGGADFSYLQVTGTTAQPQVELWLESAETGVRRRLMTNDDLESIGAAAGMARARGGTYQWSPAGDAILIPAGDDLYLVSFPGKAVSRLTETEAVEEEAKFSPDGRFLAFVRDNDLWLLDLTSRNERRLSSDGGAERINGKLDWVYGEELAGRRSGTGFAWAPDSRSILYLSLDESPVPRFPLVDLLPVHPEVEWQRYPTPGDPNPIAELRVVEVVSEPGTSTSTLSMSFAGDSPRYLPRFGWVEDGSAFWYQLLDRRQRHLDLVRVSWPAGEHRTLLVEEDPAWLNLHDDLSFLADGRFLWSSERDGHRHLYLYAADGTLIRQLTTGDWEVVGVEAVDDDGGRVVFSANREGPTRRDLYAVSLDAGRPRRLTSGVGTHQVEVAPGGRWLVDTVSSANRPERMEVLAADGALVREIPPSVPATVAEYALGSLEIVQIGGDEGETLVASVLRPPGFDPARRYPVLVYVYGGPHAQVVRDAWGGRNRLFHEYIASRGVVVVSFDNRGSFGRGRAFERTLLGRLGKTELEDQLRGVAWLRAQEWVDGDRLAIWGWSYGGFMTCYAMTNAPGVFRAGVAVAPVTDWRLYDSIYTERYLGLPADNPDGYRDSSPVNQAAQLGGNLLLVHGTGDDNVHWQNTAAMVDRLYKAGRRYDLQLYPNLTHGIRGRGSYAHLYRRIAEHLLSGLGLETAPPEAAPAPGVSP